MKKFGILLMSFVFLSGAQQAGASVRENYIRQNSFSVGHSNAQRDDSKTAKWNLFWKAFTAAIYAKDKKAIASMTSKNFYDGGGGTVEQWLDAEVFLNENIYTAFKNKLKNGASVFKGYGGRPYKATGKNKSGDLFFEYANNHWQFGGVVGD